MKSSAKINVYRHRGEWFFAMWIDDEFDCSYDLDVDDASSIDAAIETARTMPLRPDIGTLDVRYVRS